MKISDDDAIVNRQIFHTCCHHLMIATVIYFKNSPLIRHTLKDLHSSLASLRHGD